MSDIILKDQLLSLRMMLFGGKGGVGKTTCAASSAIFAAEYGRKTIIISIDPAHSLGDCLGMKLLPGEPTLVNGVKNLYALEIDWEYSIREFLQSKSKEDKKLISGTLINTNIEEELFPGSDELLALQKIVRFIRGNHDFDLVIFDTAPTGHTLRILEFPELLSGWAGKFIKFLEFKAKFSRTINKFKKIFGGNVKEEHLGSIENWRLVKRIIIEIRERMMDPTFNSFVIVMNPEEMVFMETNRLIDQLTKFRIPNSNIIINKVYKNDKNNCPYCNSWKKIQRRNLLKIYDSFQNKLGKNLIEIPLFSDEVKEYTKLKELGKYLIQIN